MTEEELHDWMTENGAELYPEQAEFIAEYAVSLSLTDADHIARYGTKDFMERTVREALEE